MLPELYTEVVLNRDFADENLKAGDVAMYVDYLKHPQGGEDGAILEIYNVLGEALGMAIVPISAIESLRAEYVPSVRLGNRKAS